MNKDKFERIVREVIAEKPGERSEVIRRLAISRAGFEPDADEGELSSLPDYSNALDQMGLKLGD